MKNRASRVDENGMTYEEACELWKKKGVNSVSKSYRQAIDVLLDSGYRGELDGGAPILGGQYYPKTEEDKIEDMVDKALEDE